MEAKAEGTPSGGKQEDLAGNPRALTSLTSAPGSRRRLRPGCANGEKPMGRKRA